MKLRAKANRTALCLAVLLFLVLAGAPEARADRGVIYTEPVGLAEPGQKAFIAFNGEEELLVLATDLWAARQTAVLEFIPLPAEPAVTLAPDGAFEKLQEILKAHRVVYFRTEKSGPTQEVGGGEAVELLLHRRLGVHDVTVVRVKDPAAFAAWAGAYSRKNGFPVRGLTPQEEAVVADYCRRGFNNFVFDLVRVGEKVQSVPPLAYRFKTPALYYPLKTAALYGGSGRADLVICGDGRLLDRVYPGLSGTIPDGAPSWRASNRVSLDAAELAGVTPEVARVVTGEQELQAFRYEGPLSFRADVWVDPREILVEVNGRPLELDVPPVLAGGACFVPAKAVWEALGARVVWDAARREVVATAEGLTLRVPIEPEVVDSRSAAGQKTLPRRYVAYLNGERRDLAALAAACAPGASFPEPALRVVQGRLLLPVRLAAGLLGARAEWEAVGLKVKVWAGPGSGSRGRQALGR
ncbi:MAG: stalk domain-containing protein [Moorellales bacterium]